MRQHTNTLPKLNPHNADDSVTWWHTAYTWAHIWCKSFFPFEAFPSVPKANLSLPQNYCSCSGTLRKTQNGSEEGSVVEEQPRVQNLASLLSFRLHNSYQSLERALYPWFTQKDPRRAPCSSHLPQPCNSLVPSTTQRLSEEISFAVCRLLLDASWDEMNHPKQTNKAI